MANRIQTVALVTSGEMLIVSVCAFQRARAGGRGGEQHPRTRAFPPASQLPDTRSPLRDSGPPDRHSDPRHRKRRGDHGGLQPHGMGGERIGEI